MAKPKYDSATFPKLAEGYARDGLNDEQIAEKLGISRAAYYRYQKQHVDFLDAIKRGKAPVDADVENALLKRALGFEYEEVSTEYEKDPKTGKPTPVKTKKTIKRVPPDVGAIAFWLKNRKPEQWREKIDHTSGGKEMQAAVVMLPSNGRDVKND
ncbi:helix-turn-helix domain-containing protein [Carboxylicivirga sediminis]|uniref:Helix-turn-helix domain-containing protein n=1 Tax=Carboxylicivirga sediminis TaxID=2006564 RepID=A0A941F4A0_9BACT|nr:helix-turn-helix domain-containing protein [Carboxylicivirga sediminis]MBR8535420.1 helix-turn-helix domain-containing protein [Carboxylicivirga sediminis]